jgi:hypothetical protein
LQWGMALGAALAAISAVLAHRFLRPTATPG